MILMKKLAGGHNNFLLIFIIFLFFYSQSLFASQIYDYQTDEFIKLLNSKILSVNKYNKEIKFKIINDNFPNAYVTEDNTIFISSGLIVYSPDYISFLAVLAHEIGHIEKYHVKKRVNQIDNLKEIKSIGNIAAIAGSMIINDPQLLNTIVVNQTAINNSFLNFSQEQEKEADIYAINTLNNLNLPNTSIKKFLKLLEKKTQSNLLDEELKKFSTHPLFKERFNIINSNNESKINNYDNKLQKEFKFIQAKFMAYTSVDYLNNLNLDEKKYYEAIQDSISGNLFESLKKLNYLISRYEYNYFILETKADILMSYGYVNEALNFYHQVLEKYPRNNYIKYNIFVSSKFKNEKIKKIRDVFFENLYLMNLYPLSKTMLNKFYKISLQLDEKEWIIFFENLLYNNNDLNSVLSKLYSKTKDYNLKKLIKLYI
jgi:predicted Zn-dependent protease